MKLCVFFVAALCVACVCAQDKPGLGKPCTDEVGCSEGYCDIDHSPNVCKPSVQPHCPSDSDDACAGQQNVPSGPGSGGTCHWDTALSPGDACLIDDECAAGVCVDGVCSQPVVGTDCQQGGSCGMHLTCKGGVCQRGEDPPLPPLPAASMIALYECAREHGCVRSPFIPDPVLQKGSCLDRHCHDEAWLVLCGCELSLYTQYNVNCAKRTFNPKCHVSSYVGQCVE